MLGTKIFFGGTDREEKIGLMVHTISLCIFQVNFLESSISSASSIGFIFQMGIVALSLDDDAQENLAFGLQR